MKSYSKILFLFIVIISTPLFSQNESSDDIKIKFGGYINWTANYDSRQTVSYREGYLLLYPAEKKIDAKGDDINDKSNFNFLSIQTRLNSRIEGPQALGAKTLGFVEAEFFGTTEDDVNGFRLRHAYLSFKWENTSLLIGQTWHPMVIAEAYPLVVSFNTGSPFQPLSRNPQVRLNQNIGNGISLMAALVSQRDFTSGGPNGFKSTYIRNAGVPAAHLQVQYKNDKIICGIGGDVKKLAPQIETSKKLSTDESIISYDGMSYFKYKDTKLTFAVYGVYGQNLADLLMLGGYGVSGIDTTTGKQTYSNLNTYSFWTDAAYGSALQAGIFFGYTKNLGSENLICGNCFTRTSKINDVLRIAPRLTYSTGKVLLAAEVEHTKAGYGNPDNYGKVKTIDNISNTRFVLSTYYTF